MRVWDCEFEVLTAPSSKALGSELRGVGFDPFRGGAAVYWGGVQGSGLQRWIHLGGLQRGPRSLQGSGLRGWIPYTLNPKP